MADDDLYGKIDPENEKFAKSLKLTFEYDRARQLVHKKMEEDKKSHIRKKYAIIISIVLFVLICGGLVCFYMTDWCIGEKSTIAPKTVEYKDAVLVTFRDMSVNEYSRFVQSIENKLDSNIRLRIFADHLADYHRDTLLFPKEKDTLRYMLTSYHSANWEALRPTLKSLIKDMNSKRDTSDYNIIIAAPMPAIDKSKLKNYSGELLLSREEFRIIENHWTLNIYYMFPKNSQLNYIDSSFIKAVESVDKKVEIINY